MTKAAQRREEQQWAIEKSKLNNARKLRGMYFLGPEDLECKETMKKTHRIIGTAHAIRNAFVRFKTFSAGKPVAKNPALPDQDMHASSKLVSLRESAWKELCLHHREDRIEGINSLKSLQSCAQVYSRAPSNENSSCESRCGQRVGKARKIASTANDKSQEQKKKSVIKKGTERREDSSILLRHWTSALKLGVGTEIPKKNTEDGLYTEATL